LFEVLDFKEARHGFECRLKKTVEKGEKKLSRVAHIGRGIGEIEW